jgi:hypothetical protein
MQHAPTRIEHTQVHVWLALVSLGAYSEVGKLGDSGMFIRLKPGN